MLCQRDTSGMQRYPAHTEDEAQHHSQEATGQPGQVCAACGITSEGDDHSTALLWCVIHDKEWDRPSSHASHPAVAGHQQACKHS